MRNYRLIVCLIICVLLLLIPLHVSQAQNYFQYNVQIKSDGSADWTIIQFSNANATVDTFDEFQQKVFNLVDSASSLTHRTMSVNENSLQINTTILLDSKTTDYSFIWQNFSIAKTNELLIGDVFRVDNFFGQLYGDAALQLNYPSEFILKSVAPQPYAEENSSQTVDWSRTQDLTTNPVSIVLVNNNQSIMNQSSQIYVVIAAVGALGVVIAFVGYFIIKRVKNKKSAKVANGLSPLLTDEEKVINLLRASGGSLRQSQITEQCKFSKAKTSQLLSALERSGRITRYKSGRDKIVNLKERVKGD